ncbi:MAG TPA: c-type cytochrome [Thermoanaerobaculia bacterium]|nr:c-type cytochrome [Thermoanaerobaculia bacterium]
MNTIPMMFLAVALATQTTPAPAPAPAPAAEPTAEKAFKNIKVLKDMPASQLMPVMHLMRSALGTRCDFCHVAEGNQYELDTKEEKETAREMIRMVFAINKENFDGRTVVTCNTCHRGQEHPVNTPPIGQAQFDDTTHGSSHHGPQEALPPAAEVLDRYIQALGGRAAIEGVKSRVSRGTLLRMKVIGSGTPKAQAVNRGQEEPVEIVQQAPDRATVTVGAAPDQTVLSLNGASGTMKGPRGERPLPPQEVSRMAENIDLRYPLKLRDRADKARVLRKESIEGKEALVLRIREDDGTSRVFYFDTATGLLVRQVVNRPTVLGPDPEQTDYADYRAVGVVKVPFLVKSSFIDDNHLGTTRKVVEVKDNE